MTKEELKRIFLQTLEDKSLLTPKHDPNKLDIPWNKERTVVSHQVAENLFEFIDQGIDKVFEYQNKAGKYYEISLKSNYDYASSGVIANSTEPFAGYDRIIAVNGKKQKWHIYGEDSQRIEDNFKKGILKDRIEIL
jgi:hypothetical protein